MGIDTIVTLLFECRSALYEMNAKYANLINKIDNELSGYFSALDK